MNVIYAESRKTRYGLLRSEQMWVRCDACNWKGRRILKIYTSFSDYPFDDDPEEVRRVNETTAAEVRSAMHQAKEIQSHPSCPKCGGDVYHVRPARR